MDLLLLAHLILSWESLDFIEYFSVMHYIVIITVTFIIGM